jgi:endonuclease YncB( thermonuclease family)
MKALLILLIIFSSGLKHYEGKILWVIDGDTLKQSQVSRSKNQDFTLETLSGKVLRIIDGDTFVFQAEEGSLKVRMDGIDAPEKDQEFGLEAKEFLNAYLYKKGTLQNKGVDRYGRTLGVLFVDGVNVNLVMVQKGFAWHYKKYSDDVALADAENRARRLKVGLWKDEGALAPWEWRKREK